MPHDKPGEPPLLIWILLYPPQTRTTGQGNRTGSSQWLACKLMGYWFLANAADTDLDSLFSATDECWSCFTLRLRGKNDLPLPLLVCHIISQICSEELPETTFWQSGILALTHQQNIKLLAIKILSCIISKKKKKKGFIVFLLSTKPHPYLWVLISFIYKSFQMQCHIFQQRLNILLCQHNDIHPLQVKHILLIMSYLHGVEWKRNKKNIPWKF